MSSRLREVVGNSTTTFATWATTAAASKSKFNTPVKAAAVLPTIMTKSSNEDDFKAAAADSDVENQSVHDKKEELRFECVEKSLEKSDISRLSILSNFYSQLILSILKA